jgi:predicted regulator of Ras-like GTPase activity (Roadblock/LC7/MglB family)
MPKNEPFVESIERKLAKLMNSAAVEGIFIISKEGLPIVGVGPQGEEALEVIGPISSSLGQVLNEKRKKLFCYFLGGGVLLAAISDERGKYKKIDKWVNKNSKEIYEKFLK